MAVPGCPAGGRRTAGCSDASWHATGPLRRRHRRDAGDRHRARPGAVLRRRRHRADAVGRRGAGAVRHGPCVAIARGAAGSGSQARPSVPVRAVQGSALLSGSVNLDGALRMRAVRVAGESQYQQIVRLVERARLERPPIQRLADRFAVWFTPLTLLMCGVAWVLTGSPTSVLAVLVVATPCPLILATPVAVIAGISRAADLGVIVKTGAAIEQRGLARAVVFDKTGTLTLGHPTVQRIQVTD